MTAWNEEHRSHLTGYPSIDKPWMQYYTSRQGNLSSANTSMYTFFYERNKEFESRTALKYFGQTITYKELFANIDHTAGMLTDLGVKKGDIVSTCMLSMPEAVYLIYAINKIGAISNQLALTSPVEDLINQIQSTESKVVFTVDIAIDKIVRATKSCNVEHIVSVPLATSMPFYMKTIMSLRKKATYKNVKCWDKLYKKKHTNQVMIEPADGNAIAVIEYTGGSTGIPKGVMISNFSANAYVINFIDSSEITYERSQVFLNIIPPFLVYGTFPCLHVPLCTGVTTVLSPDSDPKKLPKLIKQYKPNHFCCGPLHINEMLHSKELSKMDLSFILSIWYGGEKLPFSWEEKVTLFMKSHGARYSIMNGYGMTETTGAVVSGTHISNMVLPFVYSNIMVVNPETNEELPYDCEGEFWISTPTMMNGYYKDEKGTNQVISDLNGEKWLHTGDLGIVRSNGTIEITGRLKRIYWRKTVENTIVRVYPVRIENIIESNKNVSRCAVVGLKNGEKGYDTVAFITLNKENDNRIENSIKSELFELCKASLPDSHVPSEIIILTKMPLTRGGKIDYLLLEHDYNQKYMMNNL
ncbi:MAG: acyl--CoA ligase [Butyrivibrio sp.]|nr:acyl--CoA ligase [Butyrivibrio sp.]